MNDNFTSLRAQFPHIKLTRKECRKLYRWTLHCGYSTEFMYKTLLGALCAWPREFKQYLRLRSMDKLLQRTDITTIKVMQNEQLVHVNMSLHKVLPIVVVDNDINERFIGPDKHVYAHYNGGRYDLTMMFGAGNEPATIEEFIDKCKQCMQYD